jgi:hypothetical protein
MKHYLYLFMIFSIVLIALAGCSINPPAVSKDMEKKFQTAIQLTDTNESFQLKVNGDEKSFRSGSDIQLTINNISPHSIVFPLESHIKLLIIKDTEWVQVKNGLTYSGLLRIAPQGTLLLDTRTTWVEPVLDNNMLKDSKKDMLLRIVMIGEIMKNDVHTGTYVGAYTDVFLNP